MKISSGTWNAILSRLTTDGYNTMEEALIRGARLIGDELQAAVVERPLIVGRITPEGVSSMFG